MPWSTRETPKCPDDSPWGIFEDKTGRLVGCAMSEEMAEKKIEMMYEEEADDDGPEQMGDGIMMGRDSSNG